MAEPEGVLPSRTEPLIDDRGILPPVAAATTAGAPEPPPAATPQPVVVDAPVVAAQSVDERLAAITAEGGLAALPPDFGDAQGDWTTVRSENPFVVLYLDPRQVRRIEPETVARHRELLQRFWQEKLRSMSQGAARFAILKKYGGPDESERLVRSYPDLIDRAYEQLATRGAIEATARRIANEKEAAVNARVDEKLEDLVVDGILQPEETRALLDFGERQGLQRSAIADRIQQRLRQRGFVAAAEATGWTLEAQLLSTAWMHSSRRTAAPGIGVPSTKKSLLLPLFVFSFVVVLVLVIAAAMRTSRIVRDTEALDSVASLTPVPSAVLPVRTTTSETPAPLPVPADESVLPPPEVVPQSAIAATEQTEARVAVGAEERRRVREELTAIGEVGTTDPQAGLDRLDLFEQSLGAELVEERIEAVQLRSALEKALLLREREREKEEASEQARLDREREWDRRVATVEELMKQPNYSGAKALADQLLAEPDIPPAAAERARQLREQALAELQRIFAGAKVKSKTGRSPRRQR